MKGTREKDTNREKDFFETRNRSDGQNAVVYLSLWDRVWKHRCEREERGYLFELVWEGGPCKLIKLGVCIPNRM